MGGAGGKGKQPGTLWPKNHPRDLDSGPAIRDSGLEEQNPRHNQRAVATEQTQGTTNVPWLQDRPTAQPACRGYRTDPRHNQRAVATETDPRHNQRAVATEQTHGTTSVPRLQADLGKTLARLRPMGCIF